MSEVLNLKHLLPERLHGRYISNYQIKRDPRPRDADIDTLAHVLVSERHGKFDLVRLVAYLLRESALTLADDARDAERYRLLRRKVCIEGGEFHIRNLDPLYIGPDAAAKLDATIDAAIAQQRTSGGDHADS